MFSRPVFAAVEPAVPRFPARSRLLAAGCLGWPASGKWIKQRHTGGSDLRDITSHEREIMHFGGCGQKSIDQGQRIGNPSTAHASVIGSSTDSTRSASPARICENHRSRDLACSGSRLRLSSIPRRISASTRTLVPISVTGVRAIQRATFGLARSPLRISEMTFVSRRNFTAQSRANRVGAAGQKCLRTPRREASSRRCQRQSWPQDASALSPA